MWPKPPPAERAPRSLALRLTLVFGLLGYLLVGAVGLLLHTTVRYSVFARMDRELDNTSRILLHRLEEDHETPDKEWLDLGDHLALRILDRQGRILVESPGMAQRTPASLFPPAANAWAWTDAGPSGRNGYRLRVVDFQGGRIHLARNTFDEIWMLRRLRNAILGVLGLAPALAALLGYRLVRLGLSPLGSLVHALEGLRPDTLRTRVDPTAVPAELASLAGALNGALGRLETAFGRLSELNGDLAHELRTPLHSLRLEAEVLVTRPGLSEEVQERLAGMLETLDHLGAVIEQMLTLSSLEDPSRLLEKARIPAAELLAGAAAPFESLAEEADVRIVPEVEAALAVHGDGVMLRRALHNLLANALRHSSPGGVVHIRARSHGAGALLEVEDRGEGMPEAVVAQVGRRFLRPDASRSRRSGGSGLGLAIVKGIAALHGGALEIRSREGQGTVIQIILPGT